MKEDFPKWLVVLWVFIAIMGFSGMTHDLTKSFTDDAWRDIIANKGCAEYYLDSKHQRQWRWK